MAGVFICYRRNDSAGSAGRLYDDLRDRLPGGLVFRDIDAIEPGVDYVAEIVRTIEGCDALVAVIGRGWIGSRDKDGSRRLDSASDLVRMEIASALEAGKVVIPILVEDAVLPSRDELPEDLHLLASRNALPISDLRWDYDVGRLATRLQTLLQRSTPSLTPPAGNNPPPSPSPSPAGRRRNARSTARVALASGIAGVVLVLLVQAVVLGHRGGSPRTGATSTSSMAPTPSSSATSSLSPIADPRPWAVSEATVTSWDGQMTVVQASTLRLSGGYEGLFLTSGQSVPFEVIRSFELLTAPSGGGPAVKIAMTLLNGETSTQELIGFLGVSASNDVGFFSLEAAKVRRVDFGR